MCGQFKKKTQKSRKRKLTIISGKQMEIDFWQMVVIVRRIDVSKTVIFDVFRVLYARLRDCDGSGIDTLQIFGRLDE